MPRFHPLVLPLTLDGMARTNETLLCETNRLCLCLRAECRSLFAVCGPCDHARRYCSEECARVSRRAKQRLAGRRYQATERGRRNHAARQARYRARRRVTHQRFGEKQETAGNAEVAEARPTANHSALAPARGASRGGDPGHRRASSRPPCCAFCAREATFLRSCTLSYARRAGRRKRPS
jgi:hypothetical protein